MDDYVLDTNIVSYSFNRHSFFAFYEPLISRARCYVSFMTVAEILEGASRGNWGSTRKADMELLLSDFVIVESNRLICTIWADIRYQRRKQPIEPADAFIAATAIAYDIPLVTHNAKNFAHILDLRIISA